MFDAGVRVFSLKLVLFLGLAVIMLAACSPGQDQSREPNRDNIGLQGDTEPFYPSAGKTPQLKGGPEPALRVEMEPDSPSAFAGQADGGDTSLENVGFGELQKQYPNTVVWRGPTNQKRVALTFDDGPDPRFTPAILDELESNDVKATFFVMGARAKEHQEILKRIHREGHVIGNHTYWHPNLEGESVGQLRWEMDETNDIIQNLVGIRPNLFRPPYGIFGTAHTESLAANGESAIFWTVDTMDWDGPSPEEILEGVMEDTGNGSIILMHDGAHWTGDMNNTVEALGPIIRELKREGYQFVTVPELLNVSAIQ
ncbi:polysaccharide deacetylase family protein [Alteribacter keqinensis]|uniref:Polysaccharide deacetylase family protein n=1 Tax=Alteribacter keqinensis TaxID=2483800 RepID=A0A3M7TUT8_9BACI|nr:polysaccharide deacetylase family protein [Alteribacter keqinensis]RNA68484.1 polysaccharide deacetylase family protein [Alteribacter keqinensis]